MASRSGSPIGDPSRFVIGAAVGYAHVLETVLGVLESATSRRRRNTVLLVLLVPLAFLAPFAYLVLAFAVFVVSVAADSYCRIAERGDVVTSELEQAAAALSAAVLGWLANLASINLAVAFRVFGFAFRLNLAVAFHISNGMLAARN